MERWNGYSQNGEDGVIEGIFAAIGVRHHACCEFGAWGGLHFSNTRLLIEKGWRAVLFEASSKRFADLQRNCERFPKVRTYCELVDSAVLDDTVRRDVPEGLDLLVVDIDGLDYEIIEGMTIVPRVICVEVNAGHHPDARAPIPTVVASKNVGQPLGRFFDLLAGRGHQLVAYTGNAFFVEETDRLPSLTPVQAYLEFLAGLSPVERGWLEAVNRGAVPPFYRFGNTLLDRNRLEPMVSVGRFKQIATRIAALRG